MNRTLYIYGPRMKNDIAIYIYGRLFIIHRYNSKGEEYFYTSYLTENDEFIHRILWEKDAVI